MKNFFFLKREHTKKNDENNENDESYNIEENNENQYIKGNGENNGNKNEENKENIKIEKNQEEEEKIKETDKNSKSEAEGLLFSSNSKLNVSKSLCSEKSSTYIENIFRNNTKNNSNNINNDLQLKQNFTINTNDLEKCRKYFQYFKNGGIVNVNNNLHNKDIEMKCNIIRTASETIKNKNTANFNLKLNLNNVLNKIEEKNEEKNEKRIDKKRVKTFNYDQDNTKKILSKYFQRLSIDKDNENGEKESESEFKNLNIRRNRDKDKKERATKVFGKRQKIKLIAPTIKKHPPVLLIKRKDRGTKKYEKK